MEVLVLNGYYDMATPYFATEYTFGNLLDYSTTLLLSIILLLSSSSYRRRPTGFPFILPQCLLKIQNVAWDDDVCGIDVLVVLWFGRAP